MKIYNYLFFLIMHLKYLKFIMTIIIIKKVIFSKSYPSKFDFFKVILPYLIIIKYFLLEYYKLMFILFKKPS